MPNEKDDPKSLLNNIPDINKIDFNEYAKGKTGKQRGYLAIKGGVLYEND